MQATIIALKNLFLLRVPSSLFLYQQKGLNWYHVHLELTVTDVNDNVPQWVMEPFPYLATVSPKAPAGTKVYKLLAKDEDEDENGAIEYFLVEGKETFFLKCRNVLYTFIHFSLALF